MKSNSDTADAASTKPEAMLKLIAMDAKRATVRSTPRAEPRTTHGDPGRRTARGAGRREGHGVSHAVDFLSLDITI